METKRKLSLYMSATIILSTLFCLTGVSHAAMLVQIYKTVHSDGTITYSDQQTKGATQVVINAPTSTFESSPVPSMPAQITQTPSISYDLTVLSPQPEATIRNNLGEISIGASIEPRIGGFFQLQINEQVHESATGMFKLSGMERGAYRYSVKFINNSGKVIASSESRNVFLHQASALIN